MEVFRGGGHNHNTEMNCDKTQFTKLVINIKLIIPSICVMEQEKCISFILFLKEMNSFKFLRKAYF
jgi:hypothetical protein